MKKVSCYLCGGRGKSTFVDFKKLNFLPDGEYDLEMLVDLYGEEDECPECREERILEN